MVSEKSRATSLLNVQFNLNIIKDLFKLVYFIIKFLKFHKPSNVKAYAMVQCVNAIFLRPYPFLNGIFKFHVSILAYSLIIFLPKNLIIKKIYI